MLIYGSGFPKSHNIGKSIDKIEGNEREDLGHYMPPADSDYYKKGFNPTNPNGGICHESTSYGERSKHFTERRITKGNSEWEGWGTSLKPAHEPIVMARKPFSGTVVDNVLEWGTGGINIDDCRIDGGERDARENNTSWGIDRIGVETDIKGNKAIGKTTLGRFPANIILDEEAGRILDEQSGITKGSGKPTITKAGLGGGASRFFYCPKTSKSDRSEGNIHPTVKPTDLMSYLIRLVTPKGGVVLDPFMGSGSTGKGAVREGMVFIGIERESEYFEIAEARIQNEIDNLGKPKKVSKQKETKVEPIVENKFWE
jgi:site-specific DNA-methyltransferase (adenine-specific)